MSDLNNSSLNNLEKLDSQNDLKSPKSYNNTLLLNFFLGILGVHRFYLGKIESGIAMFLTLGGCGIWSLVDLIITFTGNTKDSDGLVVKSNKSFFKNWLNILVLILLILSIILSVRRFADNIQNVFSNEKIVTDEMQELYSDTYNPTINSVIGETFVCDVFELTTSNQRIVTDKLGETFVVFDFSIKSLKDRQMPYINIIGINDNNEIFIEEIINEDYNHASSNPPEIDKNQIYKRYIAFKVQDKVTSVKIIFTPYTGNNTPIILKLQPY